MSYPLTEREKKARAKADALNNILANSSIASASELAMARRKEQQLEALATDKRAQDMVEQEATLRVRQEQGAANRQSQADLVDRIYPNPAVTNADGTGPDLPTGQVNKATDEAKSFIDIDTAIAKAESVIAAGGDFKGMKDVFIGLLREGEHDTFANLANTVLYSKNEKAARALIGAAQSEIRRALSGMAVTGTEVGFNADNDPNADGISQEDAVARLKLRQQLINNHRKAVKLEPLGQPAAPAGGPKLNSNATQYLNLGSGE